MTRSKATSAGVALTPAGNWQLHHAGDIAGPGETITVPAELAESWQATGLAEPA